MRTLVVVVFQPPTKVPLQVLYIRVYPLAKCLRDELFLDRAQEAFDKTVALGASDRGCTMSDATVRSQESSSPPPMSFVDE